MVLSGGISKDAWCWLYGQGTHQPQRAASMEAEISQRQCRARVPASAPINIIETQYLYSLLWNLYIVENPSLLYTLNRASGLSDIYGQEGHVCQATELWRIKQYGVVKLKLL